MAFIVRALFVMLIVAGSSSAGAESATFTIRQLTVETGLRAAQAALAKCRAEGFQVTVAVVDRSGVTQVVLRDRFAGSHTPDMAQRKAWTAASFKVNTADLDREMQPGRASFGVRYLPNVASVAGGMMIEAGGALLGAIGVSGAPAPASDDICAKAGIAAIAESLEF